MNLNLVPAEIDAMLVESTTFRAHVITNFIITVPVVIEETRKYIKENHFKHPNGAQKIAAIKYLRDKSMSHYEHFKCHFKPDEFSDASGGLKSLGLAVAKKKVEQWFYEWEGGLD